MFVGAINSDVRSFLVELGPALNGRTCVVGCSGNFTSETVLTQFANPKAIYSNDVSLYSCLAGAYITGTPFRLDVADENLQWLNNFTTSVPAKLATVMILLDMLTWEKQANPHQKRMWDSYFTNFPFLHEKTLERIANVNIRLNGYFAGDVFDHFKQHDEKDAVFMCYAPTYSGGYERMYKRLDQIFSWDEPKYSMLDEAARDRLFAWMRDRDYVWYDDRIIPGLQPVMIQKSGRQRTVYIYSNVKTRSIYVADPIPQGLPKLPLAGPNSTITADSTIFLKRIKTSDLALYKNAFLGKNILFGQGTWAFAVVIDGVIWGFIEFSKGKYGINELYLNSDFIVPNTPYKRLSKLMPALAVCGETQRMMQKINVLKLHSVSTTAFTDKAVSMKYRGVLELQKRGQTPEGLKFLNYGSDFNSLSWKEILNQWLMKHGSTTSSDNSMTN